MPVEPTIHVHVVESRHVCSDDHGLQVHLIGDFRHARRLQDGSFSIVTAESNASVAPIHNRMPLVLGPGESSAWLRSNFATLANRDTIALSFMAEL